MLTQSHKLQPASWINNKNTVIKAQEKAQKADDVVSMNGGVVIFSPNCTENEAGNILFPCFGSLSFS